MFVQAMMSLGSFGYVAYTSAQKFAHGGGSNRFIWVVLGGALVFLLFGWFFLRTTFGRRAVEFDSNGITQCFRLPPLPERRKFYRAQEVGALKVTTFEHAKPGDRSPHWLQLDMGGKKKVLVMDLPIPHLDWLRKRIWAVVKDGHRDAES